MRCQDPLWNQITFIVRKLFSQRKLIGLKLFHSQLSCDGGLNIGQKKIFCFFFVILLP